MYTFSNIGGVNESFSGWMQRCQVFRMKESAKILINDSNITETFTSHNVMHTS